MTPRLGWNIASDTIGRGGTPYEFFRNTLVTNEAIVGATIVLSKRSVLVTGVSAAAERGDQSKPYRLIPMFARGVEVAAGATTDEVNAARLPVRPYEQLPKERDRVAVAGRLMHRFAESSLRIEQRLYIDSWSNRAATTDARFLVDTSPRLTIGPHVRFHAQTGANFFARVYHADVEPVVTVPAFRTTDRELGPFYAFTGGASAWWRLSEEGAGTAWMLYGSGDVSYSRYVNSLYLSSRIATYATVGVEVAFE